MMPRDARFGTVCGGLARHPLVGGAPLLLANGQAQQRCLECLGMKTLLSRLALGLAAGTLWAGVATVATVANAAITTRGPDMAYDSQLNVTWLTDARLFDTLGAALGGTPTLMATLLREHPYVVESPSPYSELINVPGLGRVNAYTLLATSFNGMVNYTDFARDVFNQNTVSNWYGTQAFVNYLNAERYAGFNDWRLPRLLDGSCILGYNADRRCPLPAPDDVYSEVQSLMLSLGYEPGQVLSRIHDPAYKLFSGLGNMDYLYWLDDEIDRLIGGPGGAVVDYGNFAWALRSDGSLDGGTVAKDKWQTFSRMLILRDGDVVDSLPGGPGSGGSLPVPNTALLVMLAAGLAAWRRAGRQWV
jgi:hypothetical protein